MAQIRFDIVPLEGVGPVHFGATRTQARKTLTLLGGEFETFRKSERSKHPTDAFDDLGMHVYYTGAKPAVEFVEVFPDEGGTFVLNGTDVFSVGYRKLIAVLSTESRCVDDEGGCMFTFPDLEIGVWRSDSGAKRWESVGIGRRGYYSRLARYKKL